MGRLAAKLVGMVNGTTVTDGSITAYKYDDHGRLEKVKYNYSSSTWPISLPVSITTGDVTYAYEGNSSLKTSMIDSSGTSEYTYDIMGRLENYTPPQPSGHAAVVYTYNNLGQKKSITSGSYSVSYDYYANGWLQDIWNGTQNIAHYSYTAVGNRDTVTLGNGTSTVYAYHSTDPRYFINSITHKRGTTTLATIDYTAVARDKVGNPKSMTDWVGTWTYGYDANNRLDYALPPDLDPTTGVARPVPEQPAGGDYGYDWVGNRLNTPTSPNPMVYNKADQLTLWPGMHSYTYYKDGSMKEVKNAAETQTLRTYTYTHDGLLRDAIYRSGYDWNIRNTWDGDRNRVKLEVDGASSEKDGTYSFVYDTTAGIPAVIEEKKDGGSTVFYFREPGGGLIARVEDSSIRYYHFDELGSTRMLTDSSGNITDRYAYDAHGGLVSHQKTVDSANQPFQYVGRFGYYTNWQYPDFSLLQLGLRFYEPQTGRFTQRDSIPRATHSVYGYCSQSPTTAVDPSGALDLRLECEKCAARKAMDVAARYRSFWKDPDIDGGPSNAMQHCIWTCLTYTRCGKIPSYFNNGHEYFTPGGT